MNETEEGTKAGAAARLRELERDLRFARELLALRDRQFRELEAQWHALSHNPLVRLFLRTRRFLARR